METWQDVIEVATLCATFAALVWIWTRRPR